MFDEMFNKENSATKNEENAPGVNFTIPQVDTPPASSNATQDGPQFDEKMQESIEKAKSDGWNKQVKNFIKNNKYKVMSGLAAIVLVAAGFIAAQSVNENGQAGLSDANESPAVTTEDTEESESVGEVNLTDQNSGGVLGAAESGDFTETAEKGEGVTHLARKAVASYLEENNLDLNAEQKVYAEDYLQNLKGSRALETGEKVSFTGEQIQEAYEKANALSEAQLENLQQYSQNVQF